MTSLVISNRFPNCHHQQPLHILVGLTSVHCAHRHFKTLARQIIYRNSRFENTTLPVKVKSSPGCTNICSDEGCEIGGVLSDFSSNVTLRSLSNCQRMPPRFVAVILDLNHHHQTQLLQVKHIQGLVIRRNPNPN